MATSREPPARRRITHSAKTFPQPLFPGSEGSTKELEVVNTLNRVFYRDLQTCPNLAWTQTSLGEVFCVQLAVSAAWTEETDRSDIDDAWVKTKEVGENVLAKMDYCNDP